MFTRVLGDALPGCGDEWLKCQREGTFDRFVPGVDSLTAADVEAAARNFIRPADATVVVVGDASRCRDTLEVLGRPIEVVSPEF